MCEIIVVMESVSKTLELRNKYHRKRNINKCIVALHTYIFPLSSLPLPFRAARVHSPWVLEEH